MNDENEKSVTERNEPSHTFTSTQSSLTAAALLQEQVLKSILDQMPSGVSIAEAPSGRLLYHNQEAINLIRHPMRVSDDYLGYRQYGALHTDGSPYEAGEYPIARALFGETIVQEEMMYRRGDGTLTTLSVNASPIRNDSGEIILAVSTFHDISSQKAIEKNLKAAIEQAESANRVKSAFLANMSHEIRTPLTSIIGFASILTRSTEGKTQHYAHSIEQSGLRLTETLNSVLMLARLEAGRVELDLEPVPLASEVKEIAQMYRKQAADKNLAFSVEIAPAARNLLVLIDRGALNSIVQNLISNAVKFTQKGGITVGLDSTHLSGSLEQGSPTAVFYVEDSGIGISNEYLSHLFEPFTQESTGLDRSFQGTGLGLAITRQLVEKVGGTIKVSSRKDYGSRFEVHFPVYNTHRGAETTEPSGQHNDHRILVVEDNADTRVLMKALLSGMGHIEVAADAVSAIETARHAIADQHPFDIFLVDINLKHGLDGVEVLKELRKMAAYEHVPMIAVTAYALPGDRERFLDEGFDDYLGKPFTADELLYMITKSIPDKSRLLKQRYGST